MLLEAVLGTYQLRSGEHELLVLLRGLCLALLDAERVHLAVELLHFALVKKLELDFLADGGIGFFHCYFLIA